MCGISGCIIDGSNAMKSVVDALTKLQNRGYDSAGICTIIDNVIHINKSISGQGENAMINLKNGNLINVSCNLALGHTRWATHGEKTLENAHPHTDENKRFAIVHNGIIENYNELKHELLEKGYNFYGQTDTEVVVKYLSFLTKNGQNFVHLNQKLHGSWAILVVDSENPDKIYFLKNGSPLIIGFNESKNKAMFVSEISGFDNDITQYTIINDGDFGYVTIFNKQCHIISNDIYEYIPLSKSSLITSPAPYDHWTIKEINDQPIALNNIICTRIENDKLIFPELDSTRDNLLETDHIIFLGCGTSYHAAQIGVKYFKEFRSNITYEVIDGADFEEEDIPIDKKTLLILLSQSGETKDLYRALVIGKQQNIKSIGIINVENSLIAREVDVCLYLKAGRENAVASTKSFTNQVVMLLLLSLWFNENKMSDKLKYKYFNALNNLSNDFTKIIDQSIVEIPKLLHVFKNQNDCFILGKQHSEWIAKEGSLKIKEISYIHAEGYSAAALKHGPFALLTKNVPVILLANNDKFYTKMENINSEVKSRQANIIYITNRDIESELVDYLFYFQTDSILFPLLSIVPLQILSYYLALDRGNNPDYPRNLAKVVTVE
ncbi:putative glucosamine-fructose-6-phosphateamino transferase [Moumouvirus australiensis]|uniref:glutamine--fructose-6-phosphate transaminase (isomerizing) n=1 Tax=Moumouvirus australiensis TaxID=2109587 RepID=A0A2P1EMF5_9VIRU|nr:putative glucosamine-fructose-6-phosphateamino transferase [Moumouvirus australiensis]AVL95038.1 putative glucosamine-fructose-6-phosphateamino transferase [Moumouvirus australiensis]